MKTRFCDDCIRDMLNTVEGEFVNEAIIYDTEEEKFYAVTEGSSQIGDYKFQITYVHGDYEIEIQYIGG